MITTVCMSPSFDKTSTLPRLEVGQVNRLEDVRYDVGGKGLNVAMVLRRLGVDANCVSCLGATDEAMFLDMLGEDASAFHFLSLPGKTRTNLKLLETQSNSVTECNEPGLPMDATQLQAFIGLLHQEASQSDYVVLSGSLPAGCGEDTYLRLMQALPEKKCVLDACGDALLLGIQARPFLIKPNLPEMEAVAGRELRTLRSIRDAALELVGAGAQHVVVSMGKYGALLTDGKQTLFSPAVTVDAKSTVGAGDAMLAGMLMGLEKGESMMRAFRCGMAAGAASVMTEGTQPLRASDFAALLPKVSLQEV